MRIIVDAMGSDDHPAPDIEGSVLAAREFGVEITLVGPQDIIEKELAKHDTAGISIAITHADEVITMDDKPADSARQKQNSSMHVGMRLVANGEAEAFVSAGNTGAALAVATLHTVKRIPGVKRPALAAIIPNSGGHFVLCDFGANSDSKPEYLVQFGVMADIYARRAIGLENPRLGLLSNGEEEGKGDNLIRETTPLLAAVEGLNYIGNVEPKEVMQGEVDVVVADGFVGNIMGKTLEAMGSFVNRELRREITAGPVTTVGGALIRPAIGRVRKRIDPEEIGGIPMLGVNGVVIIAHGRSNARAIRSAVRQARRSVEVDLVGAIREAVAKR